MKAPIIDASVAISWVFEDENHIRTDTVLDQLAEEGALVPQLWHLETRNALLTAERRGRLTAEDVNGRVDALKDLPIITDPEPDLELAFELARTYGLTIYDAIYLELAKRKNTKLATLDRHLGQAAEAEGVPLFAH